MWSAAEKDGWMLAECCPQVWLAAVFSCPCNQSVTPVGCSPSQVPADDTCRFSSFPNLCKLL